MNTYYMAGYDIETERCIKGVRSIVKQHIKYGVPATFFVLGELLEDSDWAQELKSLIDNDLFDIQSHTYSHIMFKDSHNRTDTIDLEEIDAEIKKTNKLIYAVFGRKVTGLRTPCGFENGLSGEVKLQHIIWNNGIRFVSSQLMGKHGTVPSAMCPPFLYEKDDILRPLLELPTHDWHDNVLKGYNFCPVGWPPNLPWGYPEQPPETPEQEFEIYKKGIDFAVQNKMVYYSPCLHPWSIYRFNKEAETIGLILDYVFKLGIQVCSFIQMYDMISREIVGLT